MQFSASFVLYLWWCACDYHIYFSGYPHADTLMHVLIVKLICYRLTYLWMQLLEQFVFPLSF